MVHRRRPRPRPERRCVGRRFHAAFPADGQPSGLCLHLRLRRDRDDLPARLPLMLNLIIFIPLLAAIATLLGAPARKTALGAAVAQFALSVLAFLSYDR